MKNIRVLSLFTGAGGLDIGFDKVGCKIVECIEIEKNFCETVKLNLPQSNYPDCKVLNVDIRDVNPEMLPKNVDLIIGGPPCQSFSAAGRRAGGALGTKDRRGTLFETYCKIVKQTLPKAFIFENVRGILSTNKGTAWLQILKAFQQLGYTTNWRILDAADYGVPQHRERIILVGTRKGTFLFPRPTHGPDSKGQRPYVTAFEAIKDLQQPHEEEHDLGGKYGSLLKEIPPGMNYLYFTKEYGHKNPRFAYRSRFSDFLRKADPHSPTSTIVASMGGYSGPFHWRNRRFTKEELKRLFSYPDNYKFFGNESSVLKQIGNSVAPLFAERLALAVIDQVFDLPQNIELMSEGTKLSFDRRKKEKASNTRSKHHKINTKYQQNLDCYCDAGTPIVGLTVISNVNSKKETVYMCYSEGYKHLRVISDCPSVNSDNNTYRADMTVSGTRMNLKVSSNGKEKPLAQLTLKFGDPVAGWLKEINCLVSSEEDTSIIAAWDIIEDQLLQLTQYHSMIDFFGHFTEPRPTFNLEFRLFPENVGILAKTFAFIAKFKNTYEIIDSNVYREFLGMNKEAFDLNKVVRELRSYRLDIRNNETNRIIPSGKMRFCYPFPLSVRKGQVSIVRG